MVIIGIAGKKQSGKDSVCDILKRKLSGKSFARIAFADPLKKQVAMACGVSVQYINNHKDVFRPMLQWWGTDFKRNLVSKDYWLNMWLVEVKDSTVDVVVAPDVRFLNEANLIKAVGGYLVKVSRNLSATITDQHPSETELDDYRNFDFVIRNDDSLQALALCVDELVNKIKS